MARMRPRVLKETTQVGVLLSALPLLVLWNLGGCAATDDGEMFRPGVVVIENPRGVDPSTGLLSARNVTPCIDSVAKGIATGAKIQAAERAEYFPGYVALKYPMGDLPRDRGVCTDVVIRSLRHAGFDLQALLHKDLVAHFDIYPKSWGLKRADYNIDHRRVPNQMCFFGRHGKSLPMALTIKTRSTWQPGDLVYWKLDDGLDHCGVLSDGINAKGWPLVVHNAEICREEDCLASWKIIGHYRYPLR